MPHSNSDRDLFLVTMRLVALISGFYLLCGGSLTLLKLVYLSTTDGGNAGRADTLSTSSNSIHHHQHEGLAASAPTGRSHGEVQYIDATFSSFRSIALNGMLLPSLTWVLCQQIIVAVGMAGLIASVVDVFRSVVDYAVSTYVVHVVVATCVLHGFPTSVVWWCIVVSECTCVIIVAEILVAKKQRSSMMRTVRRLEDGHESDEACPNNSNKDDCAV